MNIHKIDQPALILIDIQKGFEDTAYWGGQRNNPDAEKKAAVLLWFWRENQLPVFHVKHCSTNPASLLYESNKGNEFQEIVKPIDYEQVIKKSVNSVFIGTNLQEQLVKAKINQLVIVGLTTDQCVSTSVRMAGNLGFDTFLVSDATATFRKKGINGQIYSAELMHNTAIASLNEEFATIVLTDTLIKQLHK